jgi:lysophospholipase L1-like esterase
MWRPWAAGLVLVLAGITSCGGDDDTTAATTDPPAGSTLTTTSATSTTALATVVPTTAGSTDEALQLAVIGDSLTRGEWIELFRAQIESALGHPVDAQVLNGMTVPEALETVSSAGTAEQQALADADVIVVQTGFNNALPDPDTGIGCGGSYGSGVMTFIRGTEDSCLAEGVATYGGLYDEIFAQLTELRAGKPTVFIASGTIDGNIDPTTDGLVAAVNESDRAEALEWTVAAYDRWNMMLAASAAAAGFVFVDLYHAFNGPDGTQPPGDLSSDGAHPSAKGDALIADLLAEVDLSVLS